MNPGPRGGDSSQATEEEQNSEFASIFLPAGKCSQVGRVHENRNNLGEKPKCEFSSFDIEHRLQLLHALNLPLIISI